MKLKKAISFIFLVIAHLSLLAHNAFPHAISELPKPSCPYACHQKIDAKKQCPSVHSYKLSNPGTQSSSHSNNLSFDACILDEVYVRTDNQSWSQETYNIESPVLICLLTFNFQSIVTSSFLLSTDFKPYLLPIQSDYIHNPLGLRAPPHC